MIFWRQMEYWEEIHHSDTPISKMKAQQTPKMMCAPFVSFDGISPSHYHHHGAKSLKVLLDWREHHPISQTSNVRVSTDSFDTR